MLFKRYKYLELEKTDIGNDEHNYYETVCYIRAYNNKRAYDNRNKQKHQSVVPVIVRKKKKRNHGLL